MSRKFCSLHKLFGIDNNCEILEYNPASLNYELTEAKISAWPNENATWATFRHEQRAEKQSGQFVTPNIHHSVVYFQFLLSVSLSKLTHIIRKHCIVVRNFVMLTKTDDDGQTDAGCRIVLLYPLYYRTCCCVHCCVYYVYCRRKC